MKNPYLISIQDVQHNFQQFDAIIDVRSPGEFAEDHIPNAINCPVLNNEERIRVGTLYKQVNAFEAKKIGAALVAKNIGSHIENLFLDKPKDWKPLIYCWRGGNRSGAMTHILAKIGWHAVQLDGGYKEFRRFVNQDLLSLTETAQWRIICGATGTGKSRLIQSLASQGAQVIDLERLAQHRGSVLGKLPNQAQPSQKFFETQIWQTLRSFDLSRPIFVEAESKKIGNLRVPERMMKNMRESICIDIELALNERIRLLSDDYAHFFGDHELLKIQLDCLTHLHGKDQIQRWNLMAQDNQMKSLISELLEKHYDPAYHRSIQRNFVQFQDAQKIVLHDSEQATYDTLATKLIKQAQVDN